jgi:alcohol dehydrogenase class IV
MKFTFQIGTKVFFGPGCVRENRDVLAGLGRKAFIVTGRHSGRISGALDDVRSILDEAGIEYYIYDQIENNPTLERVKDGGMKANAFGADFIAGIGGGSPLDAAKAVAVLAANDIDPIELFKNTFENKPLPIVAIPTIAGTGSEVTPYSILTRKDLQTKKSFANADLFPRVAFIDPAYTESLPGDVMTAAAVDMLSHAVEGYLSKRSTPISDIFAEKSIKYFGKCSWNLINNDIDSETRERLLYASTLGGMVICHTGTTIVHPMGYTLTYFLDVPHGKANGVFLGEYLKFNREYASEKIDNILKLLNLKSMDEFLEMMKKLTGGEICISGDQLELFASIAIEQKSIAYNIRETTKKDIIEIMRKSLRIT